MKRRRLGDLYVRGRELAPDDGSGEPVKIWVAKLNEVDREAALRRANATKARYLIDIDGPTWRPARPGLRGSPWSNR